MRAAGSADGDVTLTVDWGKEEEIDGESDGEGGGLLHKGEEGGAGAGRRVSDGDAAPERERAAGGAAIEEAGAAGRGGVRRVVQRKELERRDHCRG